MSRVSSWQPIINKFNSKLPTWKVLLLSTGGRLTLCKSVLGALGIYYLSLDKVPASVLHKLEGIRRNFFWGGDVNNSKICWVA